MKFSAGQRFGKTQKLFEDVKKTCTLKDADENTKCLLCDAKHCPLVIRQNRL